MKKKTNNYVFELYKKVQNKDRAAEDEFVAYYLSKYGNRSSITDELVRGNARYRRALHIAYLHLTR